MKQFRLEGIVLSQRDLFEKDKSITVFTPDRGKIQLLARGALSKSRYGGLLDVLNHTRFWVYQGKSFYYINDCEHLSSFSYIRKDYNRIMWACYFLDVIRQVVPYEQGNDALYQLGLRVLSQLDTGSDIRWIKTHFHKAFLKIEGLLDSNCTHVTDQEFQVKFGDYSGKVVKIPISI